MRQYQKILLEHYSSDKIAVLPGDVVQKLMLRVCILIIYLSRHSTNFNREIDISATLIYTLFSSYLLVGYLHEGVSTSTRKEIHHVEK